MAKTNTTVNYKDERFTEVTADKNAALKESNKTYDQMITDSDKYYQEQIDAVNEYGDKQAQLQQEQTDFAIEQINQQKDQAHKDYLKEQSAAYVDYQKQSNQYGTNAEQQAEMGLAHTGYSESSKVSMWNTYQNRYAMAKESYDRAVLDYNNAITEARLQNSSVLAEIAFNTLQTRLQLSLQGFQYKNQLVLEKANKKAEIEDRYHARWQDVLAQINTENAFAFQKEQFEWQKKNSKVGGGGGGYTAKPVNLVDDEGDDAPSVDMNSVLALGYGPISATKLNELVASGEVIEYEENGMLKYKKAP